MALILQGSSTPTPIHPDWLRGHHYRNAEPVHHDNLWQAELGMGPRPKVWRTVFLSEYRGRIYIRGWMRRVHDQWFSAFWMARGQFLWTGTIRGRSLTEEQAKAMLLSLAEANV